MTIATPDLQVILDPDDATESIMAQFGISEEPDPAWAAKLLPQERLDWLLDRWDAPTRTFTFNEKDKVNLRKGSKSPYGPELMLIDCSPLVMLEMLTGLARDQWANSTHHMPHLRTLRNRLRECQPSSITHLTGDELGNRHIVERWSVWATMLRLASADPEQEWLLDEVRIAVVKPAEDTGAVLQMGEVRQGWLRDLLMDLLRIRAPRVSTHSLKGYAWAVTLLSQYLATRADLGESPRHLTSKTMQ